MKMKLLYNVLCLLENIIVFSIGTLAFIVVISEFENDNFQVFLLKLFAMFTIYALYKIEED